jgi:hypothetical protein
VWHLKRVCHLQKLCATFCARVLALACHLPAAA